MNAEAGALLERARAKRAAQLMRARESTADFIELAFSHERDGRRLHNAPFHREWQDALSKNDMVVLQAPVEHAKTQQVAVAKTVHLIGQDPNRRVAIISNTADMAAKILRAIKQQIEENPLVREVFPGLARAEGAAVPWNNDAITVKRATIARDPTVQTCGAYGPLVGSRLDVIIVDDVVDFENSRTPEQRKKLIEWFDTTVMTRATEGCKIFVIGTPWDPEDLLHILAVRPGFVSLVYSAVLNPDEPQSAWVPLWPEQWPRERLIDRAQNISAHVFLRKYLCRTRLDASGRFNSGWLERAKELGKGRAMCATAPKAQGGVRLLRTFTGVDLGIGDKTSSALTCFFTIAIDDTGRRIVCEVLSGRWTAPEIIDKLVSISMRFGSTIAVESNGAQKFLIQMAQGRVPVIGLNTGGNKHHAEFGVESLAVELRNEMWVVPSGPSGETIDPEARAWFAEMLNYSPEAHTGDRLMASWVAREVARKHGARVLVTNIGMQNR